MLVFADRILRKHIAIDVSTASWRLVAKLIVTMCIFGSIYGAVMGSFSVTSPERSLQIVYAAIKVPVLLLASFAINVPAFFVLNTLAGLRNDFEEAICGIFSAQAGLAIVLASLAPFTVLWYSSFPDYNAAITFNAAMFAVASFSAQFLIRGYYRHLIVRSPKHRWMMWSWIGLYALVGVQMGWIMRPFIGSAGQSVQLFRDHPVSNAYVVLVRIISGAFFN